MNRISAVFFLSYFNHFITLMCTQRSKWRSVQLQCIDDEAGLQELAYEVVQMYAFLYIIIFLFISCTSCTYTSFVFVSFILYYNEFLSVPVHIRFYVVFSRFSM